LTGVVAAKGMGGSGLSVDGGMGEQVFAQFKSIVVTIVWSGTVSYIAFKLIGYLMNGIRVETDDELRGLDLSSHDEQGYDM
jgi:Amt family ammonium transporter